MMSSKLPWFRLYNDILDDRKIMRVSNITGQPKTLIIGFWVILLSLASTSDNRGSLELSRGIPYTTQEIADIAGLSIIDTNKILNVFKILNMIAYDEMDELISITNWDKRQFKSDDSTERVRRLRERKKDGKGNDCNDHDVTACNGYSHALDTDTDTDTESDTDTDSESDTDTESDSESEADTDSDTDSKISKSNLIKKHEKKKITIPQAESELFDKMHDLCMSITGIRVIESDDFETIDRFVYWGVLEEDIRDALYFYTRIKRKNITKLKYLENSILSARDMRLKRINSRPASSGKIIVDGDTANRLIVFEQGLKNDDKN